MSTISNDEQHERRFDWGSYFLGIITAGVAVLVLAVTYLALLPRRG